MEFIKKLEKMLKTMQPNKVIAALTNAEKLKLSKMITNMDLNKIIQKSLSQQSNQQP